jgi:hypothetical protein
MRSSRLLGCLVALTAPLWVSTAAASAVVCGQPGTDGKATSGQLTLDTEHSVQTLDFKDDTEKDSFQLYFKIAGCSITDPAAIKPALRAPGPAKDSLATPVVNPKGTLVVIDVEVTPDKFPAKQIKPVLTLSGDTIDTTIVTLTMQRKEPATVPGILALIAALVGGGWALWLARGAAADKTKPDEEVKFSWPHAATAIVAGAIAGYAVFKTAYLDPATWELVFTNVLTLVIGVASAAAGGATAGAATAFTVAKVIRKRRKRTRR